ncbi:MAG: AI-2E family transporter [Streptosporangiales bacterium]
MRAFDKGERTLAGNEKPRSARWLLARGAMWALRMLLVAGALYVAVRVLVLLGLVVVPFVAALLLTALIWPLAKLLRRVMPKLAAAWATLVISVAVLGGIGYAIGLRAAAEYPQLVDQLVNTIHQLRSLVAQMGLQMSFNGIEDAAVGWLQQHRQTLTSVAGAGATYVGEFATGLALALFITLFLLYEGERIWCWLISPLDGDQARRWHRAGGVAWETITGYVHGTAVIAVIHAIVIGLTLFFLGVPLVLPLAVLVFLGSFIPIVGALIAGGIAVLVTLVTEGLVPAVIILAVLIGENQLEGNVLQPIVMRRYVRLHPLAIGIVLVLGGILAGLIGVIVAVPATAVIYRAWGPLLGRDEPPAGPKKGAVAKKGAKPEDSSESEDSAEPEDAEARAK